MAQKFGNFRWIKEGFLDGRVEGNVVGQITIAGLGPVDVCLKGTMSGEIAGRIIRFSNSKYMDDPRAVEVLSDFEIPQIGKVSLISFDPHPLLPPHPYIEWFSLAEHHYRIELLTEDAYIVPEEQIQEYDHACESIRNSLLPFLQKVPPPSEPQEEWF
jgi:hypothetical protein